MDLVVDAVANAEASVFPPGLGEAGFFAEFVGVGEEYLAGDGENVFVVEAFEERREELPAEPVA